jgi:hypothetical protein
LSNRNYNRFFRGGPFRSVVARRREGTAMDIIGMRIDNPELDRIAKTRKWMGAWRN